MIDRLNASLRVGKVTEAIGIAHRSGLNSGSSKRSEQMRWIRDVREVRRVARLPLSSGPVLSTYRKETWSGVGEPREAMTFHAQLRRSQFAEGMVAG